MAPAGRPRKPPPEGVTLRAGSLVTEAELTALAAIALDKIGGSYADVAVRLKVTPSSVSDAARRPDVNLTELRLKILALAGYGAEGPLYRLTRLGG